MLIEECRNSVHKNFCFCFKVNPVFWKERKKTLNGSKWVESGLLIHAKDFYR